MHICTMFCAAIGRAPSPPVGIYMYIHKSDAPTAYFADNRHFWSNERSIQDCRGSRQSTLYVNPRALYREHTHDEYDFSARPAESFTIVQG